MSNLPANIENLSLIIQQAQPDFKKLAKIHGATTFEREASYALQIIRDNEFLASVATSNPDSLKYAILNIASSGLTLNPLEPEVYLVPRKVSGRQKVCADPSYRGIANSATKSGAIEWVQAVLVRAKDVFKVHGASEKPTHEFSAFEDRGDIVGVYSVTKLPGGDFLTDFMSIDEVRSIAERSESFKKNVGPWFSDREEMIKKTMIRRARKGWPKKAQAAVDSVLEIEALANPVNETPGLAQDQSAHAADILREACEKAGRTEAELVVYAGRRFNRAIESLEKLTPLEVKQLQTFLASVQPKAAAK